MKVYHVEGIRHQAVVFAETTAEAIAQAITQRLVGDWEYPAAVEVPLPKGYRLVYDPQLAATEQLELSLPLAETAAEPPHTITRSGVKVYANWRDNIIMDADAPAITWKAQRDLFGAQTGAAGQPRLASENSEDALSWNMFRSLEKTGHLEVISRALGLEDEFEMFYWGRPWDSSEPLPEIKAALNQIEPRQGYQTETDVILKGRRYLVMVESKLGKPGAQLRLWERSGSLTVPASYEAPLRGLLVDMSKWPETMHRFYQLLRHLALANELCRPEVWGLEPHLLAIVSALNRHANRPHAAEFAHFQRCLRLPSGQTHLVTWQELLARVEATLDPAVQPLLAHVAHLNYLRQPSGRVT